MGPAALERFNAANTLSAYSEILANSGVVVNDDSDYRLIDALKPNRELTADLINAGDALHEKRVHVASEWNTLKRKLRKATE